MIVAFTSGGQLGNQLIFVANMMASSLEYGISYKNIAFKAGNYFDIADATQSKYICYEYMFTKFIMKYMYGMKKLIGGVGRGGGRSARD